MTGHDTARLVAFLAGELSPSETEAVDAHLLECHACWKAVSEDTLGRAACESLREICPAEVRDRVRLAVSLSPPHPRQRPSRRRAATIGALAAIAAASLGFGFVARTAGRPSDPLALIVQEVRAATVHHAVPTSIDVRGRRLRVEEYDLPGGRVVVAYDTQPFPMPTDAHAANGMINAPWSAPVDGLHVLCFNQPRPALLVADREVSARGLEALAHQLSLS